MYLGLYSTVPRYWIFTGRGRNMPWFIVQSERKTLTIYLVEAEDSEAAAQNVEDGDYLGYFDDETTDVNVVGPFETEEDALNDDSAYVDGR